MVSMLIALALAASIEPELQRCRAIENDIERLQCFDQAVPAKVAEEGKPKADLTDPRVLVDIYLASSLPDAKGVRDYEVSDPLPCAQVDEWSSRFSETCICIDYNAKNRFGGYDGSKRFALPIKKLEDSLWTPAGLASPIRDIEGDRACSAANLSDRDPALIEKFDR
jgi:hypothetical protein